MKSSGFSVWCSKISDIEAEVHDVAVAHHVFLTFDSHFTGLAHGGFATECHIVIVFYHLGTNETFLEVGVDYTCAFRGFGATTESPRTHFVGTGGEVGLKIEKRIGSTDETRDARFSQTDFCEKLLTFFP